MPTEPSPPSTGGGRSWRKSDLFPVCVLVLLWGYVIYRIGTLWHSYEDYSFGWFVPLLCLVLFWERWKRRPERCAVRPAGGTFFMLGLFAAALLPAALFLEIIPNWRFAGWMFAAAAVGITFIILYFIGGRSWCRYFVFPLMFFFVSVPWPTRIEAPLIDKMSRLNAAVSTGSANVLGSPAVRYGTVIETAPGMVGVDEACSGIRSLQASVMIALFLGELFRYGIMRRGALLLGAMGLAFVCNMIRTTYLVCTADQHGLAAVNLRHDQTGLTIMGITLVGLLVLAWLLRPRRRVEASPTGEAGVWQDLTPERSRRKAAAPEPDGVPPRAYAEPTGADGSRFIRPALAALVVWVALVEIGMNFWFSPAERQAATETAWSFQLPAQSAEFRERPIRDAVQAMLSYDEGRSAEWRDKDGSAWQMFFFRWLPSKTRYRAIEAKSAAYGHAPEVCMKGAGMKFQANLGAQTMTANGTPLLVTTERFLDHGRNFHIFTCYWEPKERMSQSAPGTMQAIRAVLQALNLHDRGWNEKRVIKMGVWGKETDEAAQAAFKDQWQAIIAR